MDHIKQSKEFWDFCWDLIYKDFMKIAKEKTNELPKNIR